MFRFDSLQDRRIKQDICFMTSYHVMYKPFNNCIYCPDLSSEFIIIIFLITCHTTRLADTFYVPFQRTLYDKMSPLIRTVQHVNNFNFYNFVF